MAGIGDVVKLFRGQAAVSLLPEDAHGIPTAVQGDNVLQAIFIHIGNLNRLGNIVGVVAQRGIERPVGILHEHADFGRRAVSAIGDDYVVCAVASLVTGKPVKWIEDRAENLQADSFARDYHIAAEMAADAAGKITGLRVKTLADHGAADAAANPSKFPAGLYSVGTGSYDLQAAHFAVLMLAVGLDPTVVGALAAHGVYLVIAAIGVMVPGQLGASEGGFSAASESLGWTAAQGLAWTLGSRRNGPPVMELRGERIVSVNGRRPLSKLRLLG